MVKITVAGISYARVVSGASPAKSALNWMPSVSLDEGLRETIQYFLEEYDGNGSDSFMHR